MLYHLSQLLQEYNVPGSGLIGYVSFRAMLTLVLSLLLSIVFGEKFIALLKRFKIEESVRDLGVKGEQEKAGTPTMGGLIIILSIVVPCLVAANLSNVYMLLLLFCTLWLGAIGFADDYLKRKYKALRMQKRQMWEEMLKRGEITEMPQEPKNLTNPGLNGIYKIIGQVVLAVIVAFTLYETSDASAPVANVPFFKNITFSYSSPFAWMEGSADLCGWLLFLCVTVFLVVATSNGVNLTDGMDGLATGCSAISGGVLALFAYLSAHVIYSSYLSILYIPHGEEIVIYMCAFMGSLIGFLWYNTKTAQVFMGDTGSLMLGGMLAIVAILIHQEFVLPILCGVFYAECASVILQRVWFKYTKHKYSEGRRIFKMAPLHHHFQKPGDGSIKALIQKPYKEVEDGKLVVRFWIISLLLALMTLATIKIR